MVNACNNMFCKTKGTFFLVMGNTNKFCISFALVINESPLILFCINYFMRPHEYDMISLTQVIFE